MNRDVSIASPHHAPAASGVCVWLLRAALVLALSAAPQASGQVVPSAPSDAEAARDSALEAAAAVLEPEATPDSAQAAFDAVLFSRLAPLSVRLDSLREARAAARPWYARWAWPLALAVLALLFLGGAAYGVHWLAGRRLQESDAAIRAATQAARGAERIAKEAERALAGLTRDVEAQRADAKRAYARVEQQLERSRLLLQKDERAGRFSAVFTDHVSGASGDEPTPSPS